MAVKVFDGNDKKYQSWLKRHKEGYVLSMGRNQNPGFISFHRSSCFSISKYTARYSFGAFTERGYIKICGDTPEELHEWVENHIRKDGKFTRRCSKCAPTDSETIKTEDGYEPTEVVDPNQYYEGATKTISVNVYERDGAARKACIDHYGSGCSVCGFNFGDSYRDIGEGFIHVHHIVPLSNIKKGYSPDPVKDLRPVCPNCHAMLHFAKPPFSIDSLKDLLNKGGEE